MTASWYHIQARYQDEVSGDCLWIEVARTWTLELARQLAPVVSRIYGTLRVTTPNGEVIPISGKSSNRD
jgi:hypothetical protein